MKQKFILTGWAKLPTLFLQKEVLALVPYNSTILMVALVEEVNQGLLSSFAFGAKETVTHFKYRQDCTVCGSVKLSDGCRWMKKKRKPGGEKTGPELESRPEESRSKKMKPGVISGGSQERKLRPGEENQGRRRAGPKKVRRVS